jgi:hypothetical protein
MILSKGAIEIQIRIGCTDRQTGRMKNQIRVGNRRTIRLPSHGPWNPRQNCQHPENGITISETWAWHREHAWDRNEMGEPGRFKETEPKLLEIGHLFMVSKKSRYQ